MIYMLARGGFLLKFESNNPKIRARVFDGNSEWNLFSYLTLYDYRKYPEEYLEISEEDMFILLQEKTQNKTQNETCSKMS